MLHRTKTVSYSLISRKRTTEEEQTVFQRTLESSAQDKEKSFMITVFLIRRDGDDSKTCQDVWINSCTAFLVSYNLVLLHSEWKTEEESLWLSRERSKSLDVYVWGSDSLFFLTCFKYLDYDDFEMKIMLNTFLHSSWHARPWSWRTPKRHDHHPSGTDERVVMFELRRRHWSHSDVAFRLRKVCGGPATKSSAVQFDRKTNYLDTINDTEEDMLHSFEVF